MNLAMAGGLAYGGINTLLTGSPTVLYQVIAAIAVVKLALFALSSKKKKKRR